jgi:hypothetical protein
VSQQKQPKPFARYICVFLLGVIVSLVGSAKAFHPNDAREIVAAIRDQTRAIQDLTNAVRQIKR